jgi:hypothetical protein
MSKKKTVKSEQTESGKQVNRRDFLKTSLQAAGVLSLASIGGYFVLRKPNYDHPEKNPYETGIDSIGRIPAEKYCDVSASALNIPFELSKALAVDKDNNIYVSGDKSILILTKEGKKITQFATDITATALAISEDKTIYAAFESHIATYSSTGKLLKEWPAFEKKSYITSLAISKTIIFVADAELEEVHEYKTDGTLIRSIGSKDKKKVDSFILPSYFFDVAIASDNTLWAANTGKHKLVSFNADGSLRSSWGETSAAVEDFCGCCNPSHFAILKDGSFITAEKGIPRVKKYNSAGKFVGAIAGPEHFRESSTGLEIAINSENDILVLEPAVRKIHIFKI